MIRINFYFLFFSFFIPAFQNAQENIPNNFRYPLEGNKRFSGNYGEIRPNHFHAGIDFSTDPVKNLPIYSIEDGFVSRIKVGTNGYGKVLYVTHPNGYVSVYGHQHHFAKKIKDFAYSEQKKQESFEVDLYPKPGELPVKKGEVIGYTGNTGNTTGPHLHFEIRDEKTEVPLNPQLFLEHSDSIAPVCHKMAIYKISECGDPDFVKSIDLSSINKKKEMKLTETLVLDNGSGFGFSCSDKENNSGGKNQVYGISIKVGGKIIYSHKMNGISFDHARYVNWFADQKPGVKKEKFQKCFKTGNNELPIFSTIENNGIITAQMLSPGETDNSIADKVYFAEVEFFDVKGNRSKLSFNFKVKAAKGAAKAFTFACDKKNEIHLKGLDATLPPNCLFCNTNFDSRIVKNSHPGTLSPVYKLHSSEVDILKGFDLLIAPVAVPKGKEDKLCFVHFSDNLGEAGYSGGEYKDGKVFGVVKNLGLYAVACDSTAPRIAQTGLGKGGSKNLSKAKGVFFKVSDNMSGIGNFRMEINGKWVLAEHEHKTSTIFYLFDEETPKGELKISLKVWDKKQNSQEFSGSFTR
jgi:hypothetical protein